MRNIRIKGFTLIELMIVVGIVAILAALALPSWYDTVRKSRRSDGMNAIIGLHLAQERWRVNHTTYGLLGDPSDPLLNLGLDPLISPNGHYSLTITGNSAIAYTITADALSDQAKDSCGDFILTFNAGDITKTADGEDDRCWTK
jgi:type IV pilus assembly protein PilE